MNDLSVEVTEGECIFPCTFPMYVDQVKSTFLLSGQLVIHVLRRSESRAERTSPHPNGACLARASTGATVRGPAITVAFMGWARARGEQGVASHVPGEGTRGSDPSE